MPVVSRMISSRAVRSLLCYSTVFVNVVLLELRYTTGRSDCQFDCWGPQLGKGRIPLACRGKSWSLLRDQSIDLSGDACFPMRESWADYAKLWLWRCNWQWRMTYSRMEASILSCQLSMRSYQPVSLSMWKRSLIPLAANSLSARICGNL